jgi:hypothetical protein
VIPAIRELQAHRLPVGEDHLHPVHHFQAHKDPASMPYLEFAQASPFGAILLGRNPVGLSLGRHRSEPHLSAL